MRHKEDERRLVAHSAKRGRKPLLWTAMAWAFLGLLAACGGHGDKFDAQSYDEYKEPLTNAVVGSPSGVVTIGPGGMVTDGGFGGSSGGGGPVEGSEAGVGFGDGGPQGDGGAAGGFGFWHFDDCSSTSHFLTDSSGGGANADHALGAACVAGISGLGVQFRTAKDVVQVPD